MKNYLIPLYSIFLIGVFSSYALDSVSDENESDFFPIAVWAQNPTNAAAYKKNGINMYVGGSLDRAKLDLLKEANMKIICYQNNFGRENLNEPLIYAWMHGDEPDNAQLNKTTKKYDPCIDPEVIIGNFERLKKTDPTRPVYLNLGRGVAVTDWVGRGACKGKTDMYKLSQNGYLKACDIASFDIYPVNSNEEGVKDSLWYVAKGIDSLLEWSDYSKPVWCWIETTRISEKSARKPTPDEVKSEVWMALIHGASGIGYFCHSFYPIFDDAALLHDNEMIAAVKAINRQVTSLAPVLNSSTITGFASVTSSNISVPVDIMTKKHAEANYIFAETMRPGITNATFKINGGKKVRVKVIGENRTILLKNGKFSDRFSDYAVHLYKIN